MIRRLRCLILGCPPSDLSRERRELYGVPVPHYVCGSCGRAVPVLDRETRAAHYEAWHAGQVVPLRAFIITPPSAAERARVLAKIGEF